jgi:hypothetical protein
MTKWTEVNGTALRYEFSGSGDEMLVLIHQMGVRSTAGMRSFRQ